MIFFNRYCPILELWAWLVSSDYYPIVLAILSDFSALGLVGIIRLRFESFDSLKLYWEF